MPHKNSYKCTVIYYWRDGNRDGEMYLSPRYTFRAAIKNFGNKLLMVINLLTLLHGHISTRRSITVFETALLQEIYIYYDLLPCQEVNAYGIILKGFA